MNFLLANKRRVASGSTQERWLSGLLTLLPFLGLGLILALIGWHHSLENTKTMITASRAIVAGYSILYLLRWVWVEEEHLKSWRNYFFGPGLAIFILASAVFEKQLAVIISGQENGYTLYIWVIGLAAILEILVLINQSSNWLPFIERSFLSRSSPGMILVITFAILVVLGCLLLKMPKATTNGITWMDALFTSTSAVCVTGLIVVDTATAFTPLGQGIILLLIQLGAFGIVTLTFLLAVISGQGFSVSSRLFLRDLLSVDNMRYLSSTIILVIGFTLIVELLGAVALYAFWSDNLHDGDPAWWIAIFHSISAFCNAGFSIFTDGLADGRASDARGVQVVIMLLIILGGIGFPVLLEVGRKIREYLTGQRRHLHAPFLSIHTRLALYTTAILIFGGTLLLYLGGGAGQSTSTADQWWEAVFNSVTARTAGFNITDMGLLPNASVALMILLMFIGGSPGGVAGGIKTTTFAIALLNLRRILLNRRDVQVFERRVEESITNRAFAVVLLSGICIFCSTILILFFQPSFSFIDTLFEVVSAFATVGLSRGISSELSEPSKVVLIATMLIGRIGILNFFFTLVTSSQNNSTLRYPRERVIIE